MTRVAVITGAAGGIGRAAADRLVHDHHLVICDVDADRLRLVERKLGGLGPGCEVHVCDVTNADQVVSLVERAKSIGDVAGVVHAAGVSPRMAPPEAIVRINALGTVHVTDAFLTSAEPGFSLVNVASSAGHLPAFIPAPTRAFALVGAEPERFVHKVVARCRLVPERQRSGFAYALTKNFVIWYSRQRAAAFGERGAAIVSVSPGSIDTEMGRLEADTGAVALAEGSALARYGRVDEVAALLEFLVKSSPGYITGTDILVDGGAMATMTLGDMIRMARRSGTSSEGGRRS
jgi:NAD(P)-dependent dehydrogenase (short-subunit alcohol dehydrogenase family)